MARTYQLTADQVIGKARYILQDEDIGAYRWSNPELLGWLNDAVNTVLSVIPSLFHVTVQHTCIAGYRQTIESSRAVSLTEIIGIPAADASVLSSFMPGWQSATAGSIDNWMRIAGDPLGFYVYPPSNAGQVLQALIVQSPAPLDDVTDIIQIPENYEPALIDYLVAMAQAKDDESVDMTRMQAFQQTFTARIKGL